MKKFLTPFLFATVLLFAGTHVAFAHDLVPQILVKYVEAHPDATPEEIQAYAEENVPAYAERFPDGQKIFEVIKNQNTTNTYDTLLDFFKLGVEHILSGIDHILFVISLLLTFLSFREILKLTGSFTVAHSLTLILATLGAITLSPRVVEPIIALSIAVMALGTVYLKKTNFELSGWKKIGVVFFFGLFHGLGFAGLLTELGVGQSKFVLSLVSFNVGIEIGQLIIIAIALPFLILLRKSRYNDIGIKILGTVIGIYGIIWAVERVFDVTFGFLGL